MKANYLLEALARMLSPESQAEFASIIGVSVQALINWKNRDEELSPNQVALAIVKSQSAAVHKSQLETIQPVVEFYGIERCMSKRGASWQVFDTGSSTTLYA